MTHGYGWRPDLPDHRDFLFAPQPDLVRALPRKVDLRPTMPPVYDQGQLGSCTACAIAAIFEYDQLRQQEPSWTPSRLQIYYNERVKEGTADSDSGAMLRDGIKVVNKLGVAPETEWPYDIARFTESPPPDVIKAALGNTALEYRRIPRNLHAMKACLAAGFPFVLGFTVYESFESDAIDAVGRTGFMTMPQPQEQVLGGHAVVAVGYTDNESYLASNCFVVRNSWGKDWGLGGYFYMPQTYVLDRGLSSDFWVITRVT
jgi:C1A family cysteine protease